MSAMASVPSAVCRFQVKLVRSRQNPSASKSVATARPASGAVVALVACSRSANHFSAVARRSVVRVCISVTVMRMPFCSELARGFVVLFTVVPFT